MEVRLFLFGPVLGLILDFSLVVRCSGLWIQALGFGACVLKPLCVCV